LNILHFLTKVLFLHYFEIFIQFEYHNVSGNNVIIPFIIHFNTCYFCRYINIFY